MIVIRKERAGDESAIHEVNFRAFERREEAEVVDTLRKTCPEGLSLVAEEDGRIVGHILFTPAVIEAKERNVNGMGLAPMAILPEQQKKGVGSSLVRTGLEELLKRGESFVVVIGWPEYYPRFGFERASKYGIRCEYAEVPDEASMILVFDREALRGVEGVAKERPEFAAAI
jgi:putative acetyltransferase